MSALTFTIQIASVTYDIKEGSFNFNPQIEQRDKLTFTVLDPTNAFNFVKGQQITLTDSASSIQFTGTVHTSIKYRIGTGNMRQHDIDCNDMHQVADERTSNRIYTNQFSGVIVAGMTGDNLAGDGITANYAIRDDDTQAQFAAGTLSGTSATSNNGGDLELASAGSTVTIVESTTSNFATGSLTNVTAANNSLAPTATPTIKLQGTQSVPGNGNSYTYLIIWGGSFAITTQFIAYDILIDSSSPQAMIGVDILFSDGTNLRDNSVYNDVQNLPPHPKTDLAGVASDQWYHREFWLTNFTGKTVSWVYVAIEGDNAGTYTGYIKNIMFENSDHSFNSWIFNTSLNLNPPFQAQTNGYSGISLAVVNTYDCTNANRVSGSYSINSVGVLRNSFVSYDVSIPANYAFTLSYSIDGGASYFPCTNNAQLPNLPSGITLTGKSIQFLEQFSYVPNSKPNPEQAPVLTFVESVLNPSYSTSKTDVAYTTATTWTGAGTTLTKTTGTGGLLTLTGAVRYFDDGNAGGTTLYSGSGFSSDGCSNKVFSISIGATPTADAKASMDFAGSFTDQVIDVDIAVETGFTVGVVYRTSNWGNANDTYAYAVTVDTGTVGIGRGTNSTGAGAFTNLGGASISVVANNYHHLQVVVVGTNHKVYFDNILMLNITDATWAGPGKVGLRIYNPSGANQSGLWDNFGVVAALSGTWTSPNTSIASATTYGTSVMMWANASVVNSTVTILVEASLNNGSTYATCTNGGPIPGLTPGQSLSGVSVKFRVTLTALNAASFPGIQYFDVYVIGQFSSTGTRIAPVLPLTSALIAGSTVVNWNAITPTNTSVVIATSPTGSGSWTNVSNGNPIAGITTQPAPTLDTFAIDDHTSYTNTARTGGSAGTWNFDTANSRLTINTGTNALLLWTAISVSDVDLILDADQINCGGLVWRETSASNFYELDIFDSASNAGSTNIIQLFKVVANVKTQIGSNVAINFTRGTYHRFHVNMIGTAIKVYMDDVNTIINTTDASLAGPGLVGMIHVSGTSGNGDSFRNFRIQPLGQSLSGINAYTRITLNSTDPISTPQVTELVMAALHPNIGLGALIATANYKRTFISANCDELAKLSDYYWQIDPTKAMIFIQRNALPSPWILTSNDILFPDDGGPDSLSVENSADLYRNRMILIGVLDQLAVNELIPGDSVSTSWSLKYPVVGNPPAISLNGLSKTIGQKGIDTGKDFYYALNSTTLAQDTSGAILQFGIDELTISYTGQFTTEVVRDNTGGFPNTTTQSQYAALTGGSGIVEVVEDVSSKQLTVVAAQSYGDAKLQRYGVIGRTLTCMTNRTGLAVGQYVAVVIPEIGINDAAMLITAMDLTMEITLVGSQASMLYYWKLTCIEGPTLGSWQKTLTQILGYSPSSRGY